MCWTQRCNRKTVGVCMLLVVVCILVGGVAMVTGWMVAFLAVAFAILIPAMILIGCGKLLDWTVR